MQKSLDPSLKIRAAFAAVTLIALTVLTVLATDQAGARGLPDTGDGDGGVIAKRIAQFDNAIEINSAAGASSKRLLFVIEQRGVVRVLRDRRPLARPFLNISKRVRSTEDGGGSEQGLLSIEFAPDYETSRIFYVYYTGADGSVRIDRHKRKVNKPHRAKRGTRKNIISIPQPFQNHNGGTIRFGPDGHLWFATGDGGSGCDPNENADDGTSLLGKLIRISPKRAGGYDVPADNPFVEDGETRDEIWSFGLRNPFRLSFDSEAGNLAIADVGQNRTEEVNFVTTAQAKGKHFGWDYFEGSTPWAWSGAPGECNDDTIGEPIEHVPPVHEYQHSGPGFTGRSITGGLVVRDPKLPRLYGRYLYADLLNSPIRSFVPSPGAPATDDGPIGADGSLITSFGADQRGRVYFTELTGAVKRLKAE